MPGIAGKERGWREKEETIQAQFKSRGHVAVLFYLSCIMQNKTEIICPSASLLKVQREDGRVSAQQI